MKARLNLTIDNDMLESIKSYAEKNGKSISKIVENYFAIIIKSGKKKKNIIQLVEGLKPPLIDADADLKDLFYNEQAEKHGF